MTIDRTIFLLLVAALVARRLRLPYTVGLVLTGVGLTAVRVAGGAALTPHLILEAFLPPLLFEAALSLSWRDLRREGGLLFVLSTRGVLVSAAVVTVGMTVLAHWLWWAALLFGVLIAATDPVSVIATFKENKIHGRVSLLVEAESLFADSGAAIGLAGRTTDYLVEKTLTAVAAFGSFSLA